MTAQNQEPQSRRTKVHLSAGTATLCLVAAVAVAQGAGEQRIWTQRTPTASPSARVTDVLAYDSARNVSVLFGGTNASGVLLSETWEWNGTS